MATSPRRLAQPLNRLAGACRPVVFAMLLGLLSVAGGSAAPASSDAVGVDQPEIILKDSFTVVESENLRISGAGRQSRLRGVIRNDGNLAWTADRPLPLSYRWRRVGGRRWKDGDRTKLPAPAPKRLVVVLQLQTLLFWMLLGTMTAIAVIARSRWRSGAALPAFIPPEIDVYWLIAALLIKQSWVLVSAGWPPRTMGLWVSLATSILVALPLMLMPQRSRPWVTWGVNAMLSLLLCADVVYVRFFNDLPSISVLGVVQQTGQVADSILTLFEWSDLWFFADLLPAVALMPVVRRQILRRRRKWAVIGAGFLMVMGIVGVRSVRVPTSGPSVNYRFHLRAAQHLGVFGYHLWNAYGLARGKLQHAAITEDDWRLVTTVLDERRPQRAGTGDPFSVARGYNLVMIQVESLQGQLLNLEVNGQEVTPTLNRLAEEGVSFTLCLDQTSFGRTSDAELMSQASLLPDTDGPAVIRHEGNDLVGLADILGESGYSTVVAVPFRASFWNRSYSHPAFGFDTRLYDKDFEPGRRIGWGLNDWDFLRQAAGRIIDLPQPFFAYLITLSNHDPFEGFPEELEILDLHGIAEGPISGYLHSMRWADEAIGGFLERLNAAGVGQRTVIVVFGDHRAGLQRLAGSSSVVDLGSSRAEKILNRRVPLVIWCPGAGAPHGEINLPVGLLDLPPTLAALLGVNPADLPWLGRNLFGRPGGGPVVIGNRFWVDSRLIHYSTDAGAVCFDRFTGKKVATARCDEAATEADRLRAAGALILDADLQQRLRTYLTPGRYQHTTFGSVISASENRIPSLPRPELLTPPNGIESRR